MRAGDEAFAQLRKSIDELAAADVAELVAEARIEARAKVRAMLSESMAQALLERSRVEMSSAGVVEPPVVAETPPEEEQEEESPAPADLGWYVYGVVAAPGPELPDDLPGVDPLHAPLIVVEDDLAAVASQVPLADFDDETLRANLNDPEWLERRARAHEAVLDAVARLGTVIPMRLCTIYRSESALRQMLVREHTPLADGLERFAGKAEWGVKVFADRATVERAATDRNPELSGLDAGGPEAEGEAYMRRKRLARVAADGADRLIDECAGAVHERLVALAADALVNPVQRPEASGHEGEMVLNGVYLVEKDAVEELRAAVDALRGDYGPLGFELAPTGPWPPYNFVKGSIEAAW